MDYVWVEIVEPFMIRESNGSCSKNHEVSVSVWFQWKQLVSTLEYLEFPWQRVFIDFWVILVLCVSVVVFYAMQ